MGLAGRKCILQWIICQPKCSAASAASQQLTVGFWLDETCLYSNNKSKLLAENKANPWFLATTLILTSSQDLELLTQEAGVRGRAVLPQGRGRRRPRRGHERPRGHQGGGHAQRHLLRPRLRPGKGFNHEVALESPQGGHLTVAQFVIVIENTSCYINSPTFCCKSINFTSPPDG